MGVYNGRCLEKLAARYADNGRLEDNPLGGSYCANGFYCRSRDGLLNAASARGIVEILPFDV